MLRPGNRVDLIALLPIHAQGADGKQANQLATFPLFQNVLVLAVGQETGAVEAPVGRYTEKKETTGGTPLITLALAPQEANLVTFVQEQGKMRLILRSPSDPKVESLRPATWESLFAYVMPPPPPPPPKVEAPKDYVEIYRGLKRDKIEVAK
jgi:Flp pilus assembly protein CpaB